MSASFHPYHHRTAYFMLMKKHTHTFKGFLRKEKNIYIKREKERKEKQERERNRATAKASTAKQMIRVTVYCKKSECNQCCPILEVTVGPALL